MDKKFSGSFSLGLESVVLQLQNLFEGCGGDAARGLLDLLSKLNSAERERALKVFSAVSERILSGTLRLEDQEDAELKEFEESLYRELLGSMQDAANDEPRIVAPEKRKLSVLDGGKFKPLLKVKTAHSAAVPRRKRNGRTLTLVN